MTLTINVNVKCDPKMLEALQAFNHLAAGIDRPAKLPQDKPAKKETEKETGKTEKPKAETKKEVKAETKPEISMETVRAKLAAIAQAGKQVEVKKLLGEFGAAKLSDIPVENYADLLAKAEKI